MAITEESRHGLYTQLKKVLGNDEAATLMDYLPPLGWADVATKRDLEHHQTLTTREIDRVVTAMGTDLRSEIQAVRIELKDMEIGLHRDMRTLLLGVVAANSVLVGLATAAGRLI